MPVMKYRLHGNRTPPRPIKLAVPGWAGEQQPRADGSHEQPWHCLPYTESARYGVELLYPFEPELRVTQYRGRVRLTADWGEPVDDDMMWPPFRPFGEDYYSYSCRSISPCRRAGRSGPSRIRAITPIPPTRRRWRCRR